MQDALPPNGNFIGSLWQLNYHEQAILFPSNGSKIAMSRKFYCHKKAKELPAEGNFIATKWQY
jgi:hypothetical protein